MEVERLARGGARAKDRFGFGSLHAASGGDGESKTSGKSDILEGSGDGGNNEKNGISGESGTNGNRGGVSAADLVVHVAVDLPDFILLLLRPLATSDALESVVAAAAGERSSEVASKNVSKNARFSRALVSREQLERIKEMDCNFGEGSSTARTRVLQVSADGLDAVGDVDDMGDMSDMGDTGDVSDQRNSSRGGSSSSSSATSSGGSSDSSSSSSSRGGTERAKGGSSRRRLTAAGMAEEQRGDTGAGQQGAGGESMGGEAKGTRATAEGQVGGATAGMITGGTAGGTAGATTAVIAGVVYVHCARPQGEIARLAATTRNNSSSSSKGVQVALEDKTGGRLGGSAVWQALNHKKRLPPLVYEAVTVRRSVGEEAEGREGVYLFVRGLQTNPHQPPVLANVTCVYGAHGVDGGIEGGGKSGSSNERAEEVGLLRVPAVAAAMEVVFCPLPSHAAAAAAAAAAAGGNDSGEGGASVNAAASHVAQSRPVAMRAVTVEYEGRLFPSVAFFDPVDPFDHPEGLEESSTGAASQAQQEGGLGVEGLVDERSEGASGNGNGEKKGAGREGGEEEGKAALCVRVHDDF
ncbi:hypothetical protein CLOM_g9804 [Closterium sp. NIES-68]|nr:hypothetical protein CLOM_g9804 [Closterium sp. NIES-68]